LIKRQDCSIRGNKYLAIKGKGVIIMVMNILTIEEAEKKFCPMRCDGDDVSCEPSTCMAWRWIKAEYKRKGQEDSGYCVLCTTSEDFKTHYYIPSGRITYAE
jgi:hypothetical protein